MYTNRWHGISEEPTSARRRFRRICSDTFPKTVIKNALMSDWNPWIDPLESVGDEEPTGDRSKTGMNTTIAVLGGWCFSRTSEACGMSPWPGPTAT
jgi:hypothetical protein